MATEQSPLVPSKETELDAIDNAVIEAWKPAPPSPASALHGIVLWSSPAVKCRQRSVVAGACIIWALSAMAVFASNYAEQPFNCAGPPTPERGTIAKAFKLCGDEGKWKLQLLQSLYFVGGGIGVLIGGWLSDAIGRYKAIILMQLWEVLGLIGCATAQNYTMYACFRTLTGAGAIGVGPASFALPCEWIPPGWRVAVGVGMINLAYVFGEFGSIGLALLFNGWRAFLWATAVTMLVGTLVAAALMKESPAWLYTQSGKQEQALALLDQGSVDKDSLQKAQPCLEQPPTNVVQVKDADWVYKRYATWIMAFCWFTCSMTYFGISLGVGGLGSNIYESAAYSAAIEPPSYLFAILVMQRPWPGRRWTNAGLFGAGGIACLLMVVMHGEYGTRIACMMCGKFFLSAAFGFVYLYAAELFVPACRGQGLAVCSFAARLGAIVAPLNAGALGATGSYVTFGILSLIAAVVGWVFLPETVGTVSSAQEETAVNKAMNKA